MPITVRVPSTAPGARFTTYAVTLSDDGESLGAVLSCECKGWRFHGKCRHGAMAASWRPVDGDGPGDPEWLGEYHLITRDGRDLSASWWAAQD
jgi:hypothetical protein